MSAHPLCGTYDHIGQCDQYLGHLGPHRDSKRPDAFSEPGHSRPGGALGYVIVTDAPRGWDLEWDGELYSTLASAQAEAVTPRSHGWRTVVCAVVPAPPAEATQ